MDINGWSPVAFGSIDASNGSSYDKTAGGGRPREISVSLCQIELPVGLVSRSIASGSGTNGSDKRCKFAVWSVIDSDVAGLPWLLSNDPVTSSSREPTAGAASETAELGDETGETQGKYMLVLGDTANTGKTSSVLKSKSSRTLSGDSCTDDKRDS